MTVGFDALDVSLVDEDLLAEVALLSEVMVAAAGFHGPVPATVVDEALGLTVGLADAA